MATRKRKSGKSPTSAPLAPTAAPAAAVASPSTPAVETAPIATPTATVPVPTSAPASQSAPSRQPVRRWAYLLGALALCIALSLAALTWWAHQPQSLAWLAQHVAPRLLPAGHALDASGVQGSLRHGGHIQTLTWSGARGERLVAQGIDISWDLWTLLSRRHLELGTMHIQQLNFTPATQPASDTAPSAPLAHARLPLSVSVPLRIDALHWGASPEQSAQHLQAHYRFDGREHALDVPSLHWGRAHWRLSAQVQADAPLQTRAQLHATFEAAPATSQADKDLLRPTSSKAVLGRGQPLLVSPLILAAELSGPLGDAAGILDLNAHVAHEQSPPIARVHARVQPWAQQPLLQALIDLNGLNLADIAPSASHALPRTALHGQIKAGPDNADAPSSAAHAAWSLHADLRNAAAAPWQAQGLPIAAAAARVHFDGQGLWSVPQLRIEALSSRTAPRPVLEATARANARNQDFSAELHMRDFNPAILAPGVTGWPQRRINAQLSAQLSAQGQLAALAALPASWAQMAQAPKSSPDNDLHNNFSGDLHNHRSDRLDFNVQLQASPSVQAAPRAATSDAPPNATFTQALTALTLIDQLRARGQWMHSAATGHALTLEALDMQAQQAQWRSEKIHVAFQENPKQNPQNNLANNPANTSEDNQPENQPFTLDARLKASAVELTAPGLVARLQGEIAPHQGAGRLDVQLNDVAATQAWAQRLGRIFAFENDKKAAEKSIAFNTNEKMPTFSQDNPDIIWPAFISSLSQQGWLKSLQPASPSAPSSASAEASFSGQARAQLDWTGGWQPWLGSVHGKAMDNARVALDFTAAHLTHRAAPTQGRRSSHTLRDVAWRIEGTPRQLHTQLQVQANISSSPSTPQSTGRKAATQSHTHWGEVALVAQLQPLDGAAPVHARAWRAQVQRLQAAWQAAPPTSATAPRWLASLAAPVSIDWRALPHMRVRASAGRLDVRMAHNAGVAGTTSAQNGFWTSRPQKALGALEASEEASQNAAADSQALFVRWEETTLALRPVAAARRAGSADTLWPATLAVRSQGQLRGLSLAWLPMVLSLADPAAAQAAPVEGDLMLAGHWDIDTTAARAAHWRAQAHIERVGGDVRLRLPDGVQALGEDATSGGSLLIVSHGLAPRGRGQKVQPATLDRAGEAADGGVRITRLDERAATMPIGLEDVQATLAIDGQRLRVAARIAAEKTGTLQGTVSSELQAQTAGLVWAADAPVVGGLHMDVPDLGLWARLAPPGWRVSGHARMQAALGGHRAAPILRGSLAADDVALRSQLQGVALERGRLRAHLDGSTVMIDELVLHGKGGGGARILGPAGNRTPAPQDGGSLRVSGTIALPQSNPDNPRALSSAAMQLRTELQGLQVIARADRQLSVSGTLDASLNASGQPQLRGQLRADRAALIWADSSAPTLDEDIRIIHANVPLTEAAPQDKDSAGHALDMADVDVSMDLGDDFAVSGMGLTTRLLGQLRLQTGQSLTGSIRTEAGRYRAWGQALDIDGGHITFGGDLDPVLDILAIRPNLPERVGVQITGVASQPRVSLYSANAMSEAEKLSWIALGRDPALGGAEMAMLQQAALALVSGGSGAGNFAHRVGLDELGLKMPNSDKGEAAAVTLGKRLGKNLYVSYEQSLTGALGTIYILYDLSQRLTLRAQTGTDSAVDLIYTHRRD